MTLHVCTQAAAKGCNHFYCSSCGNAGLAAAYSARQLKIPITVIVPETAPQIIRDKLTEYGAEVRVHGKVGQLPLCCMSADWITSSAGGAVPDLPHMQCWDETDQLARELTSGDPSSTYIPPFDHPDIW